MRVAVTQAPSDCCIVRDAEHYNLQVDPASIERIECAVRHLPLRNFLTYLNAADSVFSTCGSKVWSMEKDGSLEPSVFASRVCVVFLREDANYGSGPLQSLAQRLAELLTREPGDHLRVELEVCCAQFGGGHRGFCLGISLYAEGATAGQAELRWGLGLARLQQALLFIARGLRQELGISG